MALANTNISWAIATLSHQNRFVHVLSRFAMLASMLSARLINPTTCSTSNFSMSKACSSGVSILPISGTTHPNSAKPSSVCWYVGLRSVAILPVSSFGDCRTKASYHVSLLRNAQLSFAVLTPPAKTSVPSQPAMVAKALTGMSSRTGVAPMVAQQKTMTMN